MLTTSKSESPLLEMRGVSKRFGSVEVLRGVDFRLHAGEVMVLAGENGAGKSTLMKILAGVHTDYQGDLVIQGKPVRFRSPTEAVDHGVAVIHQELSLIGPMSIADNLFLGRPDTRLGFIRTKRRHEKSKAWLRRLGIEASPTTCVESLPISTQQRLEIAKALSLDAKILVMDEPTSSLTAPEVERLFELIDDLRSQGVGIVYISHKMDEIARVADRVTVLRDGQLVAAASAAEAPPSRLIQWMVGREIKEQFPEHRRSPGATRLEVDGLSVPSSSGIGLAVDAASFTVRRGEVVGIGGLQGSGASELLLALFGATPRCGGEVSVDGQSLSIDSPRKAIREGIALLTADRKTSGLVLPMSITSNTTLANLGRYTTAGWMAPQREHATATRHAQALHLRAANLDIPVSTLSGGNQQKVVLAKWLETKPRVLLLDEPTRGVDVGAKREIYELIDHCAADGMAIVLISTEMPELLSLSDRLVVMHRGKITAALQRGEATAENVLAAAMGADPSMQEPDGHA